MTAEVIDGPASLVWQEAENRLWSLAAVFGELARARG